PSPVEQAEHRKRHREISRDRVEPERRLLLYRRRRVGLAPGGAEERRAPRVFCAAQRLGGAFLWLPFFVRAKKVTRPRCGNRKLNLLHDDRASALDRVRPSTGSGRTDQNK